MYVGVVTGIVKDGGGGWDEVSARRAYIPYFSWNAAKPEVR
jgi:hypothetical protein